MTDKCDLIRDLLPLYAEDMTSEYTKTIVNEHLAECEACTQELAAMRKPMKAVPSAAPLKLLRKKLMVQKVRAAAAFGTFLVLVLFLTVFAWLTTPIYFPYSDKLLAVHEVSDGSASITFDEWVTRCRCERTTDPANGSTVYIVEAFTTKLDILFDKAGVEDLMIASSPTENFSIYYSQHGVNEKYARHISKAGYLTDTSDSSVSYDWISDVLLYRSTLSGDDTSELSYSSGMIALPHLALSYYFLLALGLFILLAIALLLCIVFLRARKKLHTWLIHGMLLPLSYMLGHFCVKGLEFESYSLQRDFLLIVLAGILIYGTLLFGLKLLLSRQKAA